MIMTHISNYLLNCSGTIPLKSLPHSYPKCLYNAIISHLCWTLHRHILTWMKIYKSTFHFKFISVFKVPFILLLRTKSFFPASNPIGLFAWVKWMVFWTTVCQCVSSQSPKDFHWNCVISVSVKSVLIPKPALMTTSIKTCKVKYWFRNTRTKIS